ncbi:MAG: protein kinase [Lachnospiraceae bacterium]|nr:protein kinase [Lachnospiraceae bacterium]
MKIGEGNFVSDRFLLKEQIGGGGQGVVYLARDLKYKDFAAVKRIRASDPAGENEERLLSCIRNPYIPGLRASFVTGGYRYLCMDYIRGKTLKELLKHEVFSEKETRRIAIRISQIFSYLHQLSPPILYLDLKPANLILDENHCVYLIDFGIARQITEKEHKKTPLSALTRGYAAPEQYLFDRSLDERTDLYSIGVLLHYLLTNKNPNDPPYSFEPVHRMNPAVSWHMEGIVTKLLQPEPNARYRTAEDLLHELTARKKRRKESKRPLPLLAAAAGIGFFLFALLYSGAGKAPGQEQEPGAEWQESSSEVVEDAENHFSIHPAGGTYETYQLVEVEYPKSRGLLYYTLDGTRPTRESAVYTDGIVISAPNTELRLCLMGPEGEEEEAEESYRITREVRQVEVSLDDPAVWDLYYMLKKPWEEPLYTWELASIRSLPQSARGADHRWMRAYMPYLKEDS